MNSKSGMIFNIQHFSVHDGPGIRTIVFFKGCPLRCHWCSNPESQKKKAEIGYNREKCLGCGSCVAACAKDAVSITETGVSIDNGICEQTCPDCVSACPGDALILYGREVSAEEVMEEVQKDAPFYREKGGLTLSGGEALAQPDFALELLARAKGKKLNTALETCSCVEKDVFLEAAAMLDYLLADVKLLDDERHSRATGRPAAGILENIIAVRENFPHVPLHLRTPVIPGVNDGAEDIRAIAEFAAMVAATHYELLPYHRLGQQKYGYLGRKYPLPADLVADLRHIDFLRAEAAKICPTTLI